ncbi:hypothetical protein L6164_014961 [Bauhinia variegata]|uniref:Uncharacterized protein n=1 Tax=Bauhinia variegata TaxID=167791 RepID=A0ACB9NJ08_BAUVA|nr:hypothetical protein L6164_014961 [Bauhinia variegata]
MNWFVVEETFESRLVTRKRVGTFIEQTTRPGSIRSTRRPFKIKGSKNLEGNPSTSDANWPSFSRNLLADSKLILFSPSDCPRPWTPCLAYLSFYILTSTTPLG